MRKRGNLQGKHINIVKGEHWGNSAIIQDEVPDGNGMVNVAIEDVIVRIPVGDIHTLTAPGYERPVPGDPITIARAAIREIKSLHQNTPRGDVETLMQEVLYDRFDVSLMRIWSLAYFVTEERALDLAREILKTHGFNIQQFGFRGLVQALGEYHSLEEPPRG